MKAINFFAVVAVFVIIHMSSGTATDNMLGMGMAALIAVDGLCETIKRQPMLIVNVPTPEPPSEVKG